MRKLHSLTKAPSGQGVGCRVWGVGKKPAPKIGHKPPLLRGKKKKMYFDTQSARNTSFLEETPSFKEESPHPTPYPLHPVHKSEPERVQPANGVADSVW